MKGQNRHNIAINITENMYEVQGLRLPNWEEYHYEIRYVLAIKKQGAIV